MHHNRGAKRIVFGILLLVLLVTPLIAACARQAPSPAPAPAPSPAPKVAPAPAPKVTPAPAPAAPKASPAPAPSPKVAPKPEPITLKAVTFYRSSALGWYSWKLFMDRVNERAKGELVIRFMGGPEVSPPPDIAPAVSKGVFDIGSVPGAYYVGLVPGVEVFEYNRLMPDEERKRGSYDLINELHQKAGLFLLGRTHTHKNGFYLFTNKKVTKPQELAGQKIGDGTIAVAGLKGMGVIVTPVPVPDVFSALNTKMIDGVVWSLTGVAGFGWHESLKFVVDHGFLTIDTVNIMNLNKWNSLPKHLQELLREVAISVEKDTEAMQLELQANEWKKCQAAGMQKITFSPADAESFVETIYKAEGDDVIKKHPDVGPKLVKAFSK